MKRNWLPVACTIVAALLIGHVVAQDPPDNASPAAAGRYQVSSSEAATILIDTETSRTWILESSRVDRSQVWVPLTRLDDAEQARRWLDEDTARLQEFYK